jgi:hypothetical protein
MNEVMLALGFFVVALLYASVGHGGATGYLALLALVMPTLPHHEAATTALLLNTMVSGVALVQFSRAGAWSFRQVAPFLIASVPAAFLGGWMRITPQLFSMLLMVGLFAPCSPSSSAGWWSNWVRRMRWCQKWRDGCNRCMHFIGARSPLAWQNFFLQASTT